MQIQAIRPMTVQPAEQRVARPQNIKLPTVLSKQSNPSALNQTLRRYFSLPMAAEAQPGLGGLPYTSTRIENANLLMNIKREDFLVASLPTPPEVAEIRQAGFANMFVPEWQQIVSAMAERNGGLGNSEDGFLAFSENYGFVRLRNPRMTPEQNRRLAEISLQTGAAVEKLPSRITDSALDDANVGRWVDEVIGKFESALQSFMQDPTEGFQVKDGRKLFEMKVDPQSGLVTSTYRKLSGGLKGLVQRYAPKVLDFIDGLSAAKWVKEIPVVGGLLDGLVDTFSPLADYAKKAVQSVATGKFDWKGILVDEVKRVGTLAQTWALAGGGVVAQVGAKAAEVGARVLEGKGFKFSDLLELGKALFGKAVEKPETPEIILPESR